VTLLRYTLNRVVARIVPRALLRLSRSRIYFCLWRDLRLVLMKGKTMSDDFNDGVPLDVGSPESATAVLAGEIGARAMAEFSAATGASTLSSVTVLIDALMLGLIDVAPGATADFLDARAATAAAVACGDQAAAEDAQAAAELAVQAIFVEAMQAAGLDDGGAS